MLQRLYNKALFHVGQRIRTGHVLKVIQELVAATPGEPRVLDAGAGGGGISLAIAASERRCRVEAIELVAEKVEAARAQARARGLSNVDFSTGDVTWLDRPGRYDLVISVDVLEHIENDAAALSSVCEALVPGGRLVLHVPRAAPRRFLPCLENYQQDDHVRDGYTLEALCTRLTAAGLRVCSISGTFGAAGELAWELMQIGLRWRERPGELLRIACWPMLRLLCAVDIAGHGRRNGNGLLVVAERPRVVPDAGALSVAATATTRRTAMAGSPR
ncbi:MAG: class I SAM-dependent methyltransferase [Candidatus Eiseniibacteriota bacterium]|jgi:SAM-dependent methyltransferase